jgi:lysophospholipase L1-like esterase
MVTISLVLIISVASFLVYQNLPKPQDNPSIHSSPDLSRLACVGDSITELTSYVSELQTLLGNSSVIGNFGVAGATVTLSSVSPFLFDNRSDAAKEFQPTTVIILLGTNDARSDAFSYVYTFMKDYDYLIDKFKALDSKPQIYLVLPPPVYENNLNINRNDFSEVIIPLIKQVANDTSMPLIDLYSPMLNHPEYFIDGVHPNDKGATVIAQTIYQKIR